ncbi:MAG: hypothetical protein P8099_04705 [Gemmatimonadota bacterium]
MNESRAGWSYLGGFVVCVFAGVVAGLVFTSVATLIFLVEGKRPFEHNDVTYGSTVALYVLGFTTAGLVAGLLNPLGRTKLGAVLLGIIATVPLAWGASVLVTRQLVPDDASRFAIAMYSLTFGGGMGFIMHREFVGKRVRNGT